MTSDLDTLPEGLGDSGAEADQGGKWWPLVAVSIAIFMLLIDITVVNVALPSIQSQLGASFAQLQWVVDAYALTLAALQLTSGSLGDWMGRKRLFGFQRGVSVASRSQLGLPA